MSRENYNEKMEFPDTWEEFEKCYGFHDINEVYTNGLILIPSFRVKQWLEESESRMSLVQEAVNAILNTCNTDSISDKAMRNAAKFIQNAIDGSYTDFEKLEKEPCEDCVSRQAVLDLVADYDLSMGQVVKGIHALPPVTPQLKMEVNNDGRN